MRIAASLLLVKLDGDSYAIEKQTWPADKSKQNTFYTRRHNGHDIVIDN
jgi:hypothetical protein